MCMLHRVGAAHAAAAGAMPSLSTLVRVRCVFRHRQVADELRTFDNEGPTKVICGLCPACEIGVPPCRCLLKRAALLTSASSKQEGSLAIDQY